MSYATLAPSADQRRIGVIGVFIRSVFARINRRGDPRHTGQTTGALSEKQLADIGRARGMISGAPRQSAEFRR